MRLLLVDNYDSYTYNLFQLLAGVAGFEPLVLKNDDPRLHALGPDDVDALVISPGPGRPQHLPDLGWTWELLQRHESVPVLGVCLGHQALGHHAGAQVVEGVPRHGHIELVAHDGRDLFRGLPPRFRVVRYHSLQVVDLPPAQLQACAWTEDGTVMALRHLSLPRWGVQFHPESVATDCGRELVANFLDLAAARCRSRHDAVTPVLHTGTKPAGASHRATAAAGRDQDPAPSATLDLVVRRLEYEPDTAQVHTELYAESERSFWLDSSLVEEGRARFSFLGDDSGPLGETLTYRVGTGHVEVRRQGQVTFEQGSIFEVLKRRLVDRKVGAGQLPFDLDGGYVGWFGYELKAETGGIAAHRSAGLDAAWIFADRLVAVDHEEHVTYLVATCAQNVQARREARTWLRDTARFMDALHARDDVRATVADPVAVLPDERSRQTEPWEAGLVRPRAQYLADVADCLDELARGESYEICLTNQFRADPVVDPLRFYRHLRQCNPAPYAAFLRVDGTSVMSSSPELFLKIGPTGALRTTPIKGTARRDPDPLVDERLRASLVHSPKTRAELLMIVDLLRNDFGRVCDIGSVDVPRYMQTETYATVHQLVSTISGQLRQDVVPVDCVRACFPGGSMTGAPKVRTMRIIDRLENAPRGVYSGALGFFGCGGGAELSIVIRTAVDDGIDFTIGVGGAIVLASDPVEEYDETVLKGRVLHEVHGAVEEGRRSEPA